MMSDLQPYLLTSPPARRQLLRLTLKSPAMPRGAADGAWWPHSLNPLAEFPAVIAGMTMRLGTVSRLVYNEQTWGEAPRSLLVDGETVRLEEFPAINPRTIMMVGPGWGRRELLVIPPGTAADEAEFELANAARPDVLDDIEQVLRAE